MKVKTKPLIFWLGIVLLVAPSLVHAYLLMPFPGSQDLNAITVAYYLEKIVVPLCIAGGIVIIGYFFKYFPPNTIRGKIVKGELLPLPRQLLYYRLCILLYF